MQTHRMYGLHDAAWEAGAGTTASKFGEAGGRGARWTADFIAAHPSSLKGNVKRQVNLQRCEVAGVALPEAPVRFHNVQSSGGAPLKGSFAIADDGQAKLTITTNIEAPSGRSKARRLRRR